MADSDAAVTTGVRGSTVVTAAVTEAAAVTVSDRCAATAIAGASAR
jgi:hypothetical protein